MPTHRNSVYKCARSRLVSRAITAAENWRTTLRDTLLSARKDRDAEIRELVRVEVDERMTAAAAIATTYNERAVTPRAEAAVLTDLLGDV